MNESNILADIAINFTTAMYALPVIILGMWLATKNWYFYFLTVVGIVWVAFVISRPVYDIWLNPDVSTIIKIMSWSIPPIFFVILNVGAVFSIREIKGRRYERNN